LSSSPTDLSAENVVSADSFSTDTEVKLSVSIYNNNKSDEVDTYSSLPVEVPANDVAESKPDKVDAYSLLPATGITEMQNVEGGEAVMIRKQKNRIMCQCGSAVCRKYLFWLYWMNPLI